MWGTAHAAREGHRDYKALRACSDTTEAAFQACGFHGWDDYWIAVGKCSNTSTRKSCLQDARDGLRSSRKECHEQREARRGICTALGQRAYDPVIDPNDFQDSTTINNPYFPLTPGTTQVFQGGGETIVVEVTTEKKEILGVNCMVVRDRTYEGGIWDSGTHAFVPGKTGKLKEDTLDYYAQDARGRVWYLGEIAQNFENGELVNLDGSWKAGLDGAKPGIVMQATRVVGDIYRQEFLLGEAEDMAEILSVNETVTFPSGGGPVYANVLKTKEWTPLDPEVTAYKLYAPGVGLVQEFSVDEPGAPVNLIDSF